MSDTGEVTVQSMDELVAKAFAKRAEIEKRKEELTALNKELNNMQAEIVGKLRALGRENYKTEQGTVSIVENWRFNLPQDTEAKKAMFKHFRAKGGDEMLFRYATVNSQAYNAFCLAEWDEAKERGEGVEYRAPGGSAPQLFETIAMRKKS